ncbi:MAG: hypothetical protein F4029_03620 [Gammaproteobacteria bacterium]|nr:hypothetical protein [Gammaproteobacteria bacterium]MYF27723.1 hypothetical protein [Gammaproteobacteria bacterium]MYK45298.1 hypothetical protein [Gammaproteobacteria bacterium]
MWRGDTKRRRSAARRNPSTAVRCRLLARVLVAIALAVPCVGAAQDEGPGVIDQVRSSLDGLLLRDDLTAQQVAVTEEMQAWLDALREQDLNPLHMRLLDAIARGLPHSAGELSVREIVDTVAALVDLVVDDELDEEQAAELEAKLVVDPDDIFSRTRLVRHYDTTRLDGSARAHGKHVVWLVENAPYAYELRRTGDNRIFGLSAGEAYSAGFEAWRRHVEREPDNPVFLARYARFVELKQPSLAVDLLERAHRVDARNPWLAEELGTLYLRAAMRADERAYDAQAAAKALRQFDRAYDLADDDIMRHSVLGQRAWAAFAAKRYDLAKQHAQAMLDANPPQDPDGDLLHKGNTILGRIALIEGDVALAKMHLLESGKVPTSPSLGSFGPSMTLASELLAMGQREVVLDYFDLCAIFWDAEELNTWRVAIDTGQTPDFGHHAWLR